MQHALAIEIEQIESANEKLESRVQISDQVSAQLESQCETIERQWRSQSRLTAPDDASFESEAELQWSRAIRSARTQTQQMNRRVERLQDSIYAQEQEQSAQQRHAQQKQLAVEQSSKQQLLLTQNSGSNQGTPQSSRSRSQQPLLSITPQQTASKQLSGALIVHPAPRQSATKQQVEQARQDKRIMEIIENQSQAIHQLAQQLEQLQTGAI